MQEIWRDIRGFEGLYQVSNKRKSAGGYEFRYKEVDVK